MVKNYNENRNLFTEFCLLNATLCHFGILAFFPALILGWALFNRQFFAICMFWFSCCSANNRPFCFCDLFVALKQKLMSLKPSRNIMSPINPHRRSQEILNQHKPNQPALPFYTKKGGSCLDFSTYTRQSIPDNVTVPSEYGGDTVLYKQCQVFTSPSRPPDKTDSVSHIPPSVCPRLCLHLFPTGYIDRIWVLVTSTSQHKASEWDSGCHYRGSQIPPACA